jgi:actin-related protein
MEVQTYIKDGMIEDWDMLEQILDYSYAKIIKSESEYHPVLFSEAAVSVMLTIKPATGIFTDTDPIFQGCTLRCSTFY